MNQDKQRIAIAEACGWERRSNPHGLMWNHARKVASLIPGMPASKAKLKMTHGETDGVVIPDYLNDLNAMHEAEKTLDDDQRVEYVRRLTDCDFVEPEELDMLIEHSDRDLWQSAHATAAKRAEAFLKTIGKWEDQ